MYISCNNQEAAVEKQQLRWDTLPSVPDETGFAGSFGGTSNGALIVAGGSNFPNGGTPWNGGKKVWYDHIFVLEKPGGEWMNAGKLPRPLGYGVSISTPEGLICIGGSNASGYYAAVFRLSWQDGSIKTDTLPSLPSPIANTSGALVGNCIYVAGGLEAPDSAAAAHNFWMLDLSKTDSLQWQSLPAWPGEARMLAVAGALDDNFYLFSGTALHNGKRSYLSDAYRFNPKTGWVRCKDLPQPVVAAPSPAWTVNGQLLIMGGDSGKDADKAAILKEHHPGFSNEVLAYNGQDDSWQEYAKIKVEYNGEEQTQFHAPVTTTAINWKGMLVLPGGEIRPGIRTPQVLTAVHQ